jgi:hypothetical protein
MKTSNKNAGKKSAIEFGKGVTDRNYRLIIEEVLDALMM